MVTHLSNDNMVPLCRAKQLQAAGPTTSVHASGSKSSTPTGARPTAAMPADVKGAKGCKAADGKKGYAAKHELRKKEQQKQRQKEQALIKTVRAVSVKQEPKVKEEPVDEDEDEEVTVEEESVDDKADDDEEDDGQLQTPDSHHTVEIDSDDPECSHLDCGSNPPKSSSNRPKRPRSPTKAPPAPKEMPHKNKLKDAHDTDKSKRVMTSVDQDGKTWLMASSKPRGRHGVAKPSCAPVEDENST